VLVNLNCIEEILLGEKIDPSSWSYDLFKHDILLINHEEKRTLILISGISILWIPQYTFRQKYAIRFYDSIFVNFLFFSLMYLYWNSA
jgi:hypothetical protein